MDPIKLRNDLVAVLDEHDVNYTSFTITTSKKRVHGQIQFEDVEAGEQKQEKLAMTTEKA
jgi:hypothetical protein